MQKLNFAEKQIFELLGLAEPDLVGAEIYRKLRLSWCNVVQVVRQGWRHGGFLRPAAATAECYEQQAQALGEREAHLDIQVLNLILAVKSSSTGQASGHWPGRSFPRAKAAGEQLFLPTERNLPDAVLHPVACRIQY